MISLVVKKVPGAVFVSIIISTLIGFIPYFGVIDLANVSLDSGIGAAFSELGTTFGAAFTEGMPTLFSDASKIPLVFVTILHSACLIPLILLVHLLVQADVLVSLLKRISSP